MTPITLEHARASALEARREELLTVKEFAFVVRRHPEYIRELCRRGQQAGAARVGGHWLIDITVAIPSTPQHAA